MSSKDKGFKVLHPVATGKIQRNNYYHRSYGPSLTGKMMSVFLTEKQGTHRNVKSLSEK